MNIKGKSTLEIYENNLRVKNYSERTIKMYIHYVKLYINSSVKETSKLTLKDLDEYLLNFKYSSISQQNQIINSLKLFYKYCLNKKDIHLSKIERPRGEKKLP
jgi:site-specific recombinase XerD